MVWVVRESALRLSFFMPPRMSTPRADTRRESARGLGHRGPAIVQTNCLGDDRRDRHGHAGAVIVDANSAWPCAFSATASIDAPVHGTSALAKRASTAKVS